MTFLSRTRSPLLLLILVPLLARPASGWAVVQCLEGAPCAVTVPVDPHACCHKPAPPPVRPMPMGDCCIVNAAPPVQFVAQPTVATPSPLLFLTFERPSVEIGESLSTIIPAEPPPARPPQVLPKQGRGARPPPACADVR